LFAWANFFDNASHRLTVAAWQMVPMPTSTPVEGRRQFYVIEGAPLPERSAESEPARGAATQR
jgi:hypothetical protein